MKELLIHITISLVPASIVFSIYYFLLIRPLNKDIDKIIKKGDETK